MIPPIVLALSAVGFPERSRPPSPSPSQVFSCTGELATSSFGRDSQTNKTVEMIVSLNRVEYRGDMTQPCDTKSQCRFVVDTLGIHVPVHHVDETDGFRGFDFDIKAGKLRDGMNGPHGGWGYTAKCMPVSP